MTPRSLHADPSRGRKPAHLSPGSPQVLWLPLRDPSNKILFDERVRVAVREIRDCGASLFPEERAAILRAVACRRAEFSTGRVLAQELLAVLGFDPTPIPARPDRTPQWPEGAVGSIAHAAGICVVAVARSDEVVAIGVDVEPAEPLSDELVNEVCTAGERAQLCAGGEASGLHAKRIYCAKEAAYKCWYSITRVPLEFHDVTTTIDQGRESFTAHVRPDRALDAAGPEQFLGRVLVREGYVFAGTLVSRMNRNEPPTER